MWTSIQREQTIGFYCFYKCNYCMVCEYVWEDNPRALAKESFPGHTHSLTITFLLQQHAYSSMHMPFVHCGIFDEDHKRPRERKRNHVCNWFILLKYNTQKWMYTVYVSK